MRPSRPLSIAAALALALGASAADAQPAGPPPSAGPPAASPPPGAPGAAAPVPPPGPGAPPGRPAPGYGPPPGYGAPPGYGPPPGYGAPPGYGPPGGYYGPPPYYYPPSVNLIPPPTLPYEEGAAIPPGYTLRTRAYRPLVIAGAITFGVPYIISALVAGTAISSDSISAGEFGPLLVPVAGPFITIATAHAEGAATFWLVIDGLAQTGGVAMFIAGLAMQDKYLQHTGSTSQPTALLKPEVRIGPASAQLKWRF